METISHNPTIIDWARLAAFIDGEGCIYIAKSNQPSGTPRTYLRVLVTNTDPRLMDWLKSNFRGSVTASTYAQRTNREWSVSYTWTVGNAMAKRILESCLPFFVIKREQAELGIAHQNLIGGRRCHLADVTSQREALRDKLCALKGLSSRRIIKDLVPRESEAIN